MNKELHPAEIGEQLGFESMKTVITNMEAYCTCEERRIGLKNQADILAMRAAFSQLLKEERGLEERLECALRPGDRTIRKRRSFYYWAVASVLTCAGFIFSILSFDPYRLGWKSYLYCLGIAVVTPFLVEKVIDEWKAARLVKSLATFACVAALVSLAFLAIIRGDLLAQQFRESSAPVAVDDAPSAPEPENHFYEKTIPLLRLAMLLLALGMELGAGLALHDAWKTSSDTSDDWNELQGELREVRGRMAELIYQITALQNEPAVFAAGFWRNFYRAVLTHAGRSAIPKVLLAVSLLLPFLQCRAATPEHVTIIMAVDLTQSVAAPGPDGKTDFQKNIDGVTRILAQVPGGCRVVVLGITDQSFAQPYIVLSARVADDPGYFGERLQAARRELVQVWRRRASRLTPQFKYTDILGSLIIAQQLFDESPSGRRKILLVFSDMRHHTRDLDLESGFWVPSFRAVRRQSNVPPIPRLTGVEVYVLGVDGTHKLVTYWQSLKAFWEEYFRDSGAILLGYSSLREPPLFEK